MKKMLEKLVKIALVVGLLGFWGVPNSVFAEEDPVAYCTLTIRSDIHTETNHAEAEGLCKGHVWGYYMPHLDEFALRGAVRYNLVANPNGQEFKMGLPSVQGHSRAIVTVYTIKVEKP